MFKLHKWLLYFIIRPHKKFQHFKKCLAIFIRLLNYLQKNKKRKERLNRQKNQKNLPGAQGDGPAGPARLLPLSSSTPRTQAARWNATELLEHAEHAADATCPPRAS